MKITKLLAGAICLALFATACKKEDQGNLGPIAGQWKATYQVTTATFQGQIIRDTANILVEGDYVVFRESDTVYVVDHGQEAEVNFYRINGRSIVISPNPSCTGAGSDDFRIDYIHAGEMSFSEPQIIVVHGVTTKATVATIFKK